MGNLKPEMVWVDIETSGLDRDTCQIFELGLMVTNRWGTEIETYQTLIFEKDWLTALTSPNVSDQFCIDMHAKSGLRDDMTGSYSYCQRDGISLPSLAWAESSAVKWLAHFFPDITEATSMKSRLPMAGASVHFDRSFLEKKMPKLNGWFHYRNIDVSNTQEMCKLLNPSIDASKPSKLEAHRVISDIRDAIKLYKFQIDNFLWAEEEE